MLMLFTAKMGNGLPLQGLAPMGGTLQGTDQSHCQRREMERRKMTSEWTKAGRHWVGRLLATVLVTGLSIPDGASEKQPGGSGGPELVSIRLEPAGVALRGAGAGRRFLVLGEYSDGLQREVTGASRLWVLDPGVVRLESGGRVVSVSAGGTELRAELGGKQARAAIRTAATGQRRPFSFGWDIGGILTKRGCNSSSCHGGVKGRGGFRLSSDGTDPEEDYEWIVKGGGYQVLTAEALGPRKARINLEEPEESLLLQKPTLQVVHGGGQRLEEGTADYETILNWVRRGGRYEGNGEGGVRVERLEAYPREAVIEEKGKHQLAVTAYFSDNRQEDITEQVRYESLNEEVVRVSEEGLVEAVGKGEAAVMIRSGGQATEVRMGVIGEPIEEYPEVAGYNFIDEEVLGKLRRFHLIPSELSGDGEFMRRVCLDLTGTLPPPERVREFIGSEAGDKRARLIETLLQSPEYVDYWTFRFADLFRVKGSYGWMHLYWEWVRSSIAGNKPYDQIARERISAQGFDGPSRHYLIGRNKPKPVQQVVAEQFRVFMGRRMDCAECHNHPYDRWKQDQFWGLAAFFGRLTNTEWAPDNVVFDDPKGHEVNFGEGKSYLAFRENRHPRTKQLVPPRFPDGRVLSEANRRSLRQELAKWMTAHPYFAEAMANRMWGHFFGRGIVDPVDDFRLGNPPTHPGLLKRLAQDFRGDGYDLKHLMRRIVSSRTYQLSSQTHANNREDKLNYSYAYPRPLEAEVLLDAISAVTGVPEVFEAKDVPGSRVPAGTRAINLKFPGGFPQRFLEIYERPLRDAIPERSGRANLGQALHIMVGSTYNQNLSREGSRIHRLIKEGASNLEIIEELYLAALSRFPTREEKSDLLKLMGEQLSRSQASEDLLWALISSREFSENH